MHLSDAVLSVPVAVIGLACTSVAVATAVRQVGRAELRQTVEMGVWGAFVFAIQMLNVAIPGTGASGHLVGAVLLCFLLGPATALLTMCAVLIVQALLFGDGGLWAIGWNIWHMGVIPVMCCLPFLPDPADERTVDFGWRPVPAALLSLELAAVSVSVVVLVSGRVQLPTLVFLATMTGVHLPIAIVEGLVTAWVLRAVRRSGMATSTATVGPRSRVAAAMGILAIALMLAGGVSRLASTQPDGLEWSLMRAGDDGSTPVAAVDSETGPPVVFPDYEIPDAPGPFQSVPGLVGVLVVLLAAAGLGGLVKWGSNRKRRLHGS